MQEQHIPDRGVLVAIVNYCTATLSIDCLRSLESEVSKVAGLRVVVADNASPDGSGHEIARAIAENGWSTWARLLQLPRNGGFAYGNNAIIRDDAKRNGGADFVWLLNSDTVVRPGALTSLVDYLIAHPDVGIAGSCLEDPDGTQQCSAFRFHSIAGEFEAAAAIGPLSRLLRTRRVALPPQRLTFTCDWLSGASMMIRSKVLEQVGLMDEAFFLYYEETDLCLRARKSGWRCAFVADSRVIHLVGKSSGVTDRMRMTQRRSPYWFRSRSMYFVKNHGTLYAVASDVALMTGTLLHRLRVLATRKPTDTPRQFLRDLLHHSALWGRGTSSSSPD